MKRYVARRGTNLSAFFRGILEGCTEATKTVYCPSCGELLRTQCLVNGLFALLCECGLSGPERETKRAARRVAIEVLGPLLPRTRPKK